MQEEYDSLLERSTTDKKLLEAAWDLEEHRHLYNEAQKIAQQVSVIANKPIYHMAAWSMHIRKYSKAIDRSQTKIETIFQRSVS